MAEAKVEVEEVKTENEEKPLSSNGTTTEKEKVEDTAASDMAVLHKRITKQLEYYFGDYNMGRDKFLIAQSKIDPDGWVPVATLLTFNRLKALTTEMPVVVEAARLANEKILQVHEDGQKLRRNPENPIPELNEQRKEEMSSRTVYVKKFPLETTLDELLEFFKDHDVENIQMRKMLNKAFRGSVFIVHKTKDSAEKFLKLETVSYRETDLIRETKDDFHKRKTEERAKKNEEKAKRKTGKADTETKEESKEGEEEEGKEAKPEGTEGEESPKYKKGLVVKIIGISAETSLHEIKQFFEPVGRVAWVDFNKGDSDAWVRFEDRQGQDVIDRLKKKDKEEKIKIKESQVDLVVVDGDDEKEYWVAAMKAKEEAKKKRKRDGFDHGRSAKRGRFRRGGRDGGYKGNNKGRRGRD